LSFAAIFVVVADLFKLAMADTQQDYVALFGLVAIFYLIVVPFFLVRAELQYSPGTGTKDTHLSANVLLRYFLRMLARSAVYAFAVSSSVVIFVVVFVIVMNDGIQLAPLVETYRPVERWFGLSERMDFWLINPAVLGIAVLQLFWIDFGSIWRNSGNGPCFGIRGWHQGTVVAISVLMWVGLAVAMLNNDKLVAQHSVTAAPFETEVYMKTAQAIAGVAFGALFFAAYFLTNRLLVTERIAKAGTATGLGVGIGVFSLAGLLAGAAAVGLRSLVSVHLDPVHANLLWMQMIAFVLAFLAMYAISRLVVRRYRLALPLFDQTRLMRSCDV
jgi:hypothetical protein